LDDMQGLIDNSNDTKYRDNVEKKVHRANKVVERRKRQIDVCSLVARFSVTGPARTRTDSMRDDRQTANKMHSTCGAVKPQQAATLHARAV
jgi:hypothetical protein